MSNTPLVLLTKDNQPVTTSEIIAEHLGIQHKNILQNIDKFSKELQTINPLAFQTLKGKPLPQGGFGKSYRVAILNEEQAAFVVTLSRNTPKVVEFKLALTKAFFEAKEYIRKQQEKEHEDLKFDIKKPWYVEQLLELCQRHNMTQTAIKKVIDITERAWKQGYAVAMAKVEKEQAEQGNNNKNSDNSSVAVPFSTVLNMLTTASYITDRFQYYVETSLMINDVMRRLEIVLNDTRGLAAMADMSMPMIKGCLKGLDYTEEQKKEVDRVLSPYGQRLSNKAA